MKKRTLGLAVTVTPVNQIGEVLMHRKSVDRPWNIDTAALPTTEERQQALVLRQKPSYYMEGSGMEYAVATLIVTETGSAWMTMRDAGQDVSAESPVLERPAVRYSKVWMPRLEEWLGREGLEDCMRTVSAGPGRMKKRRRSSKKKAPANIPLREQLSFEPAEKKNKKAARDKSAPADLASLSASSLEKQISAVRD
jgi:hypothetical protein